MNHEKVKKESGEFEPFNRKKILNSLLSSGLEREKADAVIEQVVRTVTPPLTTKKIFRSVKKFMRSADPRSTMKYSLKKAIYALGPSGYPFERFISRIMEADGYRTRVGQFVKGRCVTHEVDVVAHKDSTCYVVECKFHHNGKTQSNVKTALYVHARYLDILNSGKACPGNTENDIKGMLATNTRFSSEAVKYAECVGLEVLAWKYPKGRSLENLIDLHKTYPITVIPSVNRTNVQAFLQNGLVLARDIDSMDEETLMRVTGLPEPVISRIYRHACKVCE